LPVALMVGVDEVEAEVEDEEADEE